MHINPASIGIGLFLLISILPFFNLTFGRRTFREFAIGDKNFPTALLLMFILIVNFGGSIIFRELEKVYTNGLYYVIISILAPCSLLFIGRFLALRMGEFMDHLSIAESMGSIFGRTVRIVTAISSILCLAAMLSIQLNAIANTIKLCYPTEGNGPMYVALVVVFIHTHLVGIKKISLMDLFHLVTFSTLLPVLIHFVILSITDDQSIWATFTLHPNFDFTTIIGLDPRSINFIWLALLFIFPCLDPASMQAVYRSKTVWQVGSLFSGAAFTAILLKGIVIFLGIALFTHDAHLNPQTLLNHVLNMCDAVWLKCFASICILSLAISAADAHLHSAIVLLIHDVITVFKWQPKDKLNLINPCSLVITWLAWIMTFSEKDFLQQLLYALSLYVPIVTMPFMMAILGFRPSYKSVLLGMGAGGLTIAALQGKCFNFPHMEYVEYAIFPASLVNLLFLIGSHCLLPKVAGTGWIGIRDKTPFQKASGKDQRTISIRCVDYLKSLVPSKDVMFIGLGIYVLVMQMICLTTAIAQLSLYLWIPVTGLAIFVLLYPSIKNYTSVWSMIMTYTYPLIVCIILFIAGLHMLSTNGYCTVATMTFYLNIIIGLLLLPWRMVVVMVIWACIYTYYGTAYRLDQSILFIQTWQGNWSMLVLIIMCISIGCGLWMSWKHELEGHGLKLSEVVYSILNARRELEQYKINKFKNPQSHYAYAKKQLNDSRTDMIQVSKMIREIETVLSSDKLPRDREGELVKTLDQLQIHKNYLDNVYYAHERLLRLEDKTIDLQQFINAFIQKFATLTHPIAIVVHNQTTVKLLFSDKEKLEQLLVDGIYYMFGREIDTLERLYLTISDTSMAYQPNDIWGVPQILPGIAFVLSATPEDLPIETVYKESVDTGQPIAPNDVRRLYKHFILRIVDALYGYVSIQEEAPKSLSCILPLNLDVVKRLRPHQIAPVLDFHVEETIFSRAQEVDLIGVLIRANTKLTESTLQEAIQFIKYCHGDQVIPSGEPYYTHPMAVAEILLEETNESAATLGALLHDVIKNAPIPISYIESRYGTEVAKIVAIVNQGERISAYPDIRAIKIKLANRMHNIITSEYRSVENRIKLAQQTLDVYVYFGELIGIKKLAKKLRKLSNEILRPINNE